MANAIAFTEAPVAMEPEKRSRPRRRSIIREFCLNTSTHALPGIARSQSIHNRLFWSISFIGFTLIMIYFVVNAIQAYFEYPTKIDLAYVSETPQYFPAVSLCNASPIRFDQLIEPFVNYTRTLNLTDWNDTSTLIPIQASFLSEFIISIINRNESLEDFFYPLSAILQSCQFNSVPCSAADFIQFTSSMYGFCYTFNAKLKNPNNISIRYANEYAGDGVLSLGLYVHSHQYVPYIRDGIGIVALVHDNTQLPLIEYEGIELAPGRRHKLGYRKKAIYFAPPPYSQCTDKVSNLMEAAFTNYNGADYGYSQTICYQICIQVYTYEQCGCVSPTLWNIRATASPNIDRLIVAPLCNISSICFIRAAITIAASDVATNKYCSDCRAQCINTNFIIETSSLLAPLPWQYSTIKAFVEQSNITLPKNWTNDWHEQIQNNYLGVSIVRETDIVENYTQTATLGIVDVLSNIGGQSGLWIGISFLSIMEVIEMLYRLCRHQFHLIKLEIQRKRRIATQ